MILVTRSSAKTFRLLGSKLVLPYQLVLRKTAERSSGKKE
jgi:hypothetical protein